jgi:hypothetical protein
VSLGLRVAVPALRVALVVGVVLGALYARVITSGERELSASTEGLRAGDAHEATVRARRAAGYYAPGAPHVGVAYVRLMAIAAKAEGLGDRDLALLAWRAVRTAAIETRWLVTPHADDLDRANRAIARLSAGAPRPPGTRSEPPAKIEREQLELLTRDETPRAPWVVLLVVAFVAWLGGAAAMVRRGVSATGHVAWRRALPGLVVAAAGVAAWLVAIWRA